MNDNKTKKVLLGYTFVVALAIFFIQVIVVSFNASTATAAINDQDSGWPVCNGWLSTTYKPEPCRKEALRRAQDKNFYRLGLPTPPSGITNPNTPGATNGSDRAWYNWGSWDPAAPSERIFLSDGTTCGLGPTVCRPATPTPTHTPTSTPTVTPSLTVTVTPTPTGEVTVTPTPTGEVTVTPTPSVPTTPTVTPTPGVKGDETVFGFNLKKTLVGTADVYDVGELVAYNVTLENTGTEVIEKITMRDVYTPQMRVEAVYLMENGTRTNITSSIVTGSKDSGMISPVADITSITGDLNPGDVITLQFVFKATGMSDNVCNQAFASANDRTEISSQKVCIDVDGIVPITD